MQSVSLGILLFDTAAKNMFFVNGEATRLLAETVDPGDYAGLHELLLSQTDPRSSEPVSPPPIRLGDRLLGYTAYGGNRFVWMFIRDISEKVRLEAVAEAVELMNSIGYVFSTVRHEIGNPVNSVKTALSVLKNNLDEFPRSKVLQYIDRSLKELGRVEDLLTSLKSFSMYEEFRPREAKVGPCLRTAVSLVSPEFDKEGIRTSVTLHPKANSGYFDPRALHQVLLNLLANAADALVDRPSPEIQLRTVALQGRIGIQVADNGCGVSDSQKPLLFKPFATTKPTGTGLGLVISKKMLAKMGGTIEIDSQADVGTTVTITLPEGPLAQR